MPLPPRWFRRLFFGPLMVALAAVLLAGLPVLLPVALLLSPILPGRLRLLRILWAFIVYVVWDAAALIVLFGLWLASGFGWKKRSPAFQRVHYVVTGAFLDSLYKLVRGALNVDIEIVGTDPDVALPGRPEIVVCRHAGPGDSFILIHSLVNWFDREPRIVLKDTLQWDPAIDVLLNRLPTRFIAPGRTHGEDIEKQIFDVTVGLDPNDALVIFPEGGNFTPKRRIKAINRLRALGLERMAKRAENMRHVLAPKPGGLNAAIDAAPDAGVIFVAHTGLDKMLTVGDVWRELPTDKTIMMSFWSVPPEEIPTTEQERVEWLFDWWKRIDDWIEAHQPQPARPMGPKRRER
ncbi:1-acyl-sn-glycerol-3-phosphate acyltransferase [Catenuloplanes japonicus]|uniref:1-acyl-sn-glycerol-3-phosphate acyltransferase n=1 Tax=Catenuloplanes japonicus TaxID=33876 RepID=UPI000525DC8B|nr:1-acyl-sn-glycerol-3-phosphate acyltransferase [Catenuloplanes japonicus]